MSNTQLLINQGQYISTRKSLSTAYNQSKAGHSDPVDKDCPVEMSCPWLINSYVLLISEFRNQYTDLVGTAMEQYAVIANYMYSFISILSSTE